MREKYEDIRRGRHKDSSDRRRLEESESGLDLIRSSYKEARSKDSSKSASSDKRYYYKTAER